eukprot:TCONS_00006059-protein
MPHVGFPNNGQMYISPEQLMKMTGNPASLDQLAGMLVIPLKKTAEVAIQTDPVEFNAPTKKKEKSEVSSSVQTDLKMQFITEASRYAPETIFGQIRSLDSLFECLICADEFAGNAQLQDHMRATHQHVCENCFHASNSIQEHNAHISECGKYDGEMLCMDCNNCFSSVKKLNQHRIKVHNVRMPFRCGVCNQPFESHPAVMEHMATHDNNAPEFKCRYCTKVFHNAEALNKHFQRHKEVDVEHQCRFCGKSFKTDAFLKDHIGTAHVIRDEIEQVPQPPRVSFRNNQASVSRSQQSTGSGVPTTVSSNTNRKYFLCRYCDLAFKNKELLSRHVKQCSKNGGSDVTTYVCDVCKEFFPTDDARKLHLKNDHRRQNGYRCPKCSKVYRTWTRLKFHTKQQHLKKNCPDCSAVFTKEHVLRKHREDVHGKSTAEEGDRIYKCSDCNLTLYTLTDLTMHRRTVHPDRKSKTSSAAEFSSNATMLSFIDNQSNNISSTMEEASNKSHPTPPLTVIKPKKEPPVNHALNANGLDKPYQCERCNSTFDSEKRLKNHLGLTHGERPFVCELCNKRFQYSSQIVWHMKNHQNRPAGSLTKTAGKLWKPKNFHGKIKSKLPFVCQFCGAAFKAEKLLKNHKGVAHKIKLFTCYICSSKHGHSTELIWHIRTCKAKFARDNPGAALPEELPEEEGTNASQEDEACEKPMEENGDFATDPYTQNAMEEEEEEMDLHSTNIQLSKDEADELLQNDPEYDHGRGEYTCPLCKKTTKSITGMKTHYGRVHGIWAKESSHKYPNGHKITIWPCRNCDQEFNTFESIQAHCLEEHGLTVSKEDIDFETRQEFVETKTPSTNSKIIQGLYTCQTCGVSFDNSKSIRVHTFKKHGIILNDVTLKECRNDSDTPSPAKNANETTPVSFIKDEGIASMVTSNTEAKPPEDELRYKCPNCVSQFRSTKALRVHSYKRHNIILSKNEMSESKIWVTPLTQEYNRAPNQPTKGHDLVDAPSPCDRCGRVFGNYRALFTHYRQAHRITEPNHVFVPRKPSRTELSIQNNDETKENQASKSPEIIGDRSKVKQYPEEAASVDCPKCGRTFTNHKSFVAHLYSAHKVSKDQYCLYWPNGIPVLPRESSTCPTCNKECLDERAMRIHMFKAHGTHYRDYCNDLNSNKSDSLGSPEGLVTMVNETSFVGMDVSNEHLDLTCYVCSKVLKNRKALQSHEFGEHGIRWEGGQRLFPEEASGIKSEFSMIGNGSLHSASPVSKVSTPNSGADNKPFVCSICEASYHNRRAMTTHLCRVHKYKKEDVKAYFAESYAEEGLSMSPFVDNINSLSPTEAKRVNGVDHNDDVMIPKDDVIDDDDKSEDGGFVIDESDKMMVENDEDIVHILPRDVGDDYGGDNLYNGDNVYNGLNENDGDNDIPVVVPSSAEKSVLNGNARPIAIA